MGESLNPSPRPRPIVLCLDDELLRLDFLEDMLSNSGDHVLTASSPESALPVLLSNEVDAKKPT